MFEPFPSTLQITLHDQVAFTTYNIPLVRVGVTLHDQVAFTTFRKPRMVALCGRQALHDQVALTTLGGLLFAFN